jgi:hypothetical protein
LLFYEISFIYFPLSAMRISNTLFILLLDLGLWAAIIGLGLLLWRALSLLLS